MTPDSDYLTPDSDYLTPDSDYLTPDSDYLTPDSDYLTPDSDYLTPDSDYLTPDSDYLTPTYDYLTPTYDFLIPDYHFLAPTCDFWLPRVTFFKKFIENLEKLLYLTQTGYALTMSLLKKPKRTMAFVVPLLQSLEGHWALVNGWGNLQTPGIAMTFPDGLTLSQFITKRVELNDLQTFVVTYRQLASQQWGVVTGLKSKIRNKTRQFRNDVSDLAPGTRAEADLPALPQFEAGENVYKNATDKVKSIWMVLDTDTTIPDYTPPLLLKNNYALADYQTDSLALQNAYTDFVGREQEFSQARGVRDNLRRELDLLIDRYARRVQRFLPEGHPLLETIPKVSPPKHVTIPQLKGKGQWKADMMLMSVGWTGVVHPDCARIEVRTSPEGPTWDADSAEVAATATPTATFVLLPVDSIPAGSFVWAKVYVVLADGSEKGSKAFKLVRPEA